MRTSTLAFACAALVVAASDARADIVVFKNGRTMSVKSYVVHGENAVVRMREGGEVTFPASIIVRVDPDEVPYPEPASVPAPQADGAEGESARRIPLPDTGLRISDAALAARPFAALISSVAAAHHMDVRLVHAVIEQESNYQPRARSKKGAKGLMQLMPATARHYGVSNSYDPKSNLEAGIRHLKYLMSRLDLPTALAAYNAGAGTIKRYGGLPPYPETQNYVRSILRKVGSVSAN